MVDLVRNGFAEEKYFRQSLKGLEAKKTNKKNPHTYWVDGENASGGGMLY